MQRRPFLSWDEFCQTVEAVLAELPSQYLPYMKNLVVDVQEHPTAEQLTTVGDGHTLLGLFIGAGLPHQEYGAPYPNQVLIFRQPIEHSCDSADEVRYEIRRTLLHELAHHFGFSEADLDFFEAQPSPFLDARRKAPRQN